MRKITLLCICIMQTLFVYAQHSDAALGIKAHRMNQHSMEQRDLNMPYGSLVRYVYPGSAAEEIGIKMFDYLYAVNDQMVNDSTKFGELINQYQPGELVNVSYYRNGVSNTVSAKLSDSDDLDRPHRGRDKDPFLGVSQNHNRLPDEIDGVSVDISNNSTAQAMGMEDDDIIMKIDGDQMYNWTDLHYAIDNREVGEAITITYYRDGNIFEESRPIKSIAATHNDHSRPDGPVIVGTPEPGVEGSQLNIEEPEGSDQESLNIEGEPLPIVSNIQVEEFNVFPNPSDGIFNIQLDLPQEGRTSVQVFDSNGRRVYENNLGNFSGVFSDRIDIANTAKGIYFLLVRQNDKTLSKRLVLQ